MAIGMTAGSASIGTTEYFIISASTTATYQTTDVVLQVFVSLANMAAGDQYQITVYEKVNAGTATAVSVSVPTGAQSTLWVSPSLIVGEGYEIGIKKIAGTDRTINWSYRTAT